MGFRFSRFSFGHSRGHHKKYDTPDSVHENVGVKSFGSSWFGGFGWGNFFEALIGKMKTKWSWNRSGTETELDTNATDTVTPSTIAEPAEPIISEIQGTDTDDILDGNDEQNTLYGYGGNDVLTGNGGNDTLDGGAGTDIAEYRDTKEAIRANLNDQTVISASDTDTLISIEGISGSFYDDVLIGNDEVNDLRGLAGDDEIHGNGGDDKLNGSRGNDTIYGGAGNDFIDAGSHDDLVHGGDGDDTIYGESGNDTLFGDAGNDIIHGGVDNDWISGGLDNDLIYANAGDDEIHGDAGDDEIHASSGLNTIFAGEGNDQVTGGTDADTIHGDAGDDTIYALAGDDIIFGGDGLDYLNGMEGDDIIHSGAGYDQIYGGAGADTFVFDTITDYDGSGFDRIFDFNIDDGDRLDLSELLSGFDDTTHDLDDFLLFGANYARTYVAVDIDGAGADHSMVTIARLDGIDWRGLSPEEAVAQDSVII